MASVKNGTKTTLVEKMLNEASRLASHAEALTIYRKKEAEAEWLRAADCAEQVACLLDAEKREVDAAIYFVSAASCYARVGQYAQAVTRGRAALSFPLRKAYRQEVDTLVKDWLRRAKKQLRKQPGEPATTVS